jgi:hypothetical protein
LTYRGNLQQEGVVVLVVMLVVVFVVVWLSK